MRAKFVLTEAATGLWRNVTMTIAMILTTTIALALLGVGGIALVKVSEAKERLFFKVEVTIFLTEDVTEAQRSALDTKLDADRLVQSHEHESKEEAYSRFRELFKDTPDLVENVKPEALPESYRVKLVDPTKFQEIKTRYGTDEGVYRVQDQQEVLGAMFKMIDTVKFMVLFTASGVGLAGVLLIFNMVQVAAYSRRREIGIMKLVGASNWYVRLPFILEAAVAGLIGATLAWFWLLLCKWLVIDNRLEPLFTSGIVPKPSWEDVLLTGPILGLIAVSVASLAGWITLRFSVKV